MVKPVKTNVQGNRTFLTNFGITYEVTVCTYEVTVCQDFRGPGVVWALRPTVKEKGVFQIRCVLCFGSRFSLGNMPREFGTVSFLMKY